MRTVAVVIALVLSTPAFAGNTGFQCWLDIGGKKAWYNLSADGDKGLYTMRSGNEVVKQAQPFEVEMGFGANMKPSVKALKFVVQMAPMDYMLVITPQTGQAFMSSVSGSTARMIGACQEVDFKGL